MTRWKKDATEFEMNVMADQRGSRYVRIPKPLDEKMGSPDTIKFVVRGNRIVLE